jgi:GntR family transcriptional regulator
MPENGQVIDPVGGPAYRLVANDLRQRIAAGELPLGSAIPSTAQLGELYGVSTTVVRAAVAQLRGDGLVVGHPGKGVFVSSTPDALAERTTTVDDLATQLAALRAELGRVVSARADNAAELAALREQVSALQVQVDEVSARLEASSHSPLLRAEGGGRDLAGDQPPPLP